MAWQAFVLSNDEGSAGLSTRFKTCRQVAGNPRTDQCATYLSTPAGPFSLKSIIPHVKYPYSDAELLYAQKEEEEEEIHNPLASLLPSFH